MKAMAPRRTNEGFTIIELLVVMGIIAILTGMLVPAVIAARRTIKEGATRIEIKGLEAAFILYAQDWGTYPPDRGAYNARWDPGNEYRDYESGECLVYYLGTKFRVSDGFTKLRFTLNGGPYYEFPGDRLVTLGGGGDVFMDLLRNASERPVHWYRFDNNDAEDGGEGPPWGPWPPPPGLPSLYNRNVANVHPMGVDIWSAGRNGVDDVSTANPTQKKIRRAAMKEKLGDDLVNW